jgi:hypothetical protein
VLMACSVMAGDWGWRKERYPLYAMLQRISTSKENSVDQLP